MEINSYMYQRICIYVIEIENLEEEEEIVTAPKKKKVKKSSSHT